MSRVPPHDLDAERALLGAMLLNRHACEQGLGVASEDLYGPEHRDVHAALGALWARGDPIDPVTVTAQLKAHGHERPNQAGVLALQACTPASASAGAYVDIVADLAVCRRVIQIGDELAAQGWDANLEGAERVLNDAEERLAQPVSDVEAIDVLDLVNLPPEPADEKPYLIPGLLRARERLVLTGGGGRGKSTWIRQVLVALAAGLHPFTGLPCARRSGLIVDLQEDQRDLAEALYPLTRTAGSALKPGTLHSYSRSQGINLLARGDVRWLEGLLARYTPDLLAIGPLRKMYRQTGHYAKSSEEAVDELTLVLDDFRKRFGCALLLEGHPGLTAYENDDWRPRGSSVWLDWPEYGFGFAPEQTKDPGGRAVRVKRWREDRHAGRPWPSMFVSGQPWPWVALPEATATLRSLQTSDDLAQPSLEAF